jgi:hypothetical protein
MMVERVVLRLEKGRRRLGKREATCWPRVLKVRIGR